MMKYDTWLTTQPNNGLIQMRTTVLDPFHDNDFPVDEWTCRMCGCQVGYYLSGDHGGGWVDCWLIESSDEFLCDDCLASLTYEPDLPDLPPCDICGSIAGDEHLMECAEMSCDE